jgi:phosphoglycolate phosphatase
MMNYKYILFDFDGTLSDSAPGVMASFEASLERMGAAPPGRDILIRFVGPPLTETFTEYFGFSGEKLKEVLVFFREHYASAGIEQQKMFDGVPQTLERLRGGGKILAVATSKREDIAAQVCESYGIADYFAVIGGSVEGDGRNEKNEVIEHVLAQLGASDRSQVLMVGDRRYDVEGANLCGIDCMGVLHGYGDRQELLKAGAKYIAEDLRDAADKILL